MNIRIDKYYDVTCWLCGRHRSTDFGMALGATAPGTRLYAKKEGWREVDGRTYCPECVKMGMKESSNEE